VGHPAPPHPASWRLARLIPLPALTIYPLRYPIPGVASGTSQSTWQDRRTCSRGLHAASRKKRMARRAGHHNQQQSDEVRPEEIVEMFWQASKTMPVPTAAICADCSNLRSTPWVKALMLREQEPWEIAEREALNGLKAALQNLPQVVREYRKLANIAPLDKRQLAALINVSEMLPAAIAALEQLSGQSNQASIWHLSAEVIAMDAMTAWRLAGWTDEFGCFSRSPLVRFTQAFLARAGVTRSEGAIAMAFERGGLARLAKQVTKPAANL
jgi:hypothetical protein